MNTRTRILVAASAIGLACAATGAMAVTIAGQNAAVTTTETAVDVVNTTLSSIDLKRGVLVAGGRTYRFNAATVGFSDDRKPTVAGGVESLKNGSKVTLRTAKQGDLPHVLQIIAH
ncbi:MAG: hypothetical protein RL030_2245 [Pseudomonadota bacterium]